MYFPDRAAYAPYSTCMATPLHVSVTLLYLWKRQDSSRGVKKVKVARNSKTKTQTKRKHSCAQRYAHKYEQFLNLCLATGLD